MEKIDRVAAWPQFRQQHADKRRETTGVFRRRQDERPAKLHVAERIDQFDGQRQLVLQAQASSRRDCPGFRVSSANVSGMAGDRENGTVPFAAAGPQRTINSMRRPPNWLKAAAIVRRTAASRACAGGGSPLTRAVCRKTAVPSTAAVNSAS